MFAIYNGRHLLATTDSAADAEFYARLGFLIVES